MLETRGNVSPASAARKLPSLDPTSVDLRKHAVAGFSGTNPGSPAVGRACDCARRGQAPALQVKTRTSEPARAAGTPPCRYLHASLFWHLRSRLGRRRAFQVAEPACVLGAGPRS